MKQYLSTWNSSRKIEEQTCTNYEATITIHLFNKNNVQTRKFVATALKSVDAKRVAAMEFVEYVRELWASSCSSSDSSPTQNQNCLDANPNEIAKIQIPLPQTEPTTINSSEFSELLLTTPRAEFQEQIELQLVKCFLSGKTANNKELSLRFIYLPLLYFVPFSELP